MSECACLRAYDSTNECLKYTVAWPCIAYDEHAAIRETLTQVYQTHLKKKHGMCSIVVLDSDHETPLNVDAESNINSTQNETGSDFPWKTSAAANCCAGAAALVLCSIL